MTGALGGACTVRGDCAMLYTECNNGRCACSPGYEYDTEKQLCQGDVTDRVILPHFMITSWEDNSVHARTRPGMTHL